MCVSSWKIKLIYWDSVVVGWTVVASGRIRSSGTRVGITSSGLLRSVRIGVDIFLAGGGVGCDG